MFHAQSNNPIVFVGPRIEPPCSVEKPHEDYLFMGCDYCLRNVVVGTCLRAFQMNFLLQFSG
jgi:hypothetical protein